MSVKLKICGIRRIEDVEIINKVLPDYVGFIFAPSKRQINLETANILKNRLDSRVKTVGVFVNSNIDYITNIVKKGVIDLIQLHGNEDELYISELRKNVDIEIIKAIKVNEFNSINSSTASYILLDSGGGSGQTFDWELAPKINKPLFIAGGISIDNMREAIDFFNPFALDVSSSVETDGFKDYEKIINLSNKLDKINGEKDG